MCLQPDRQTDRDCSNQFPGGGISQVFVTDNPCLHTRSLRSCQPSVTNICFDYTFTFTITFALGRKLPRYLVSKHIASTSALAILGQLLLIYRHQRCSSFLIRFPGVRLQFCPSLRRVSAKCLLHFVSENEKRRWRPLRLSQ